MPCRRNALQKKQRFHSSVTKVCFLHWKVAFLIKKATLPCSHLKITQSFLPLDMTIQFLVMAGNQVKLMSRNCNFVESV